MFADGDWRDRAIAINTKMNIVHEHMESFRRTLDAVLSGYDGLDELRYHHATAFRWLAMLGYWALGAHAKHKQTGRLSRKYPPLACPLPYADFERVPLIKMRSEEHTSDLQSIMRSS